MLKPSELCHILRKYQDDIKPEVPGRTHRRSPWAFISRTTKGMNNITLKRRQLKQFLYAIVQIGTASLVKLSNQSVVRQAPSIRVRIVFNGDGGDLSPRIVIVTAV